MEQASIFALIWKGCKCSQDLGPRQGAGSRLARRGRIRSRAGSPRAGVGRASSTLPRRTSGRRTPSRRPPSAARRVSCAIRQLAQQHFGGLPWAPPTARPRVGTVVLGVAELCHKRRQGWIVVVRIDYCWCAWQTCSMSHAVGMRPLVRLGAVETLCRLPGRAGRHRCRESAHSAPVLVEHAARARSASGNGRGTTVPSASSGQGEEARSRALRPQPRPHAPGSPPACGQTRQSC